MSKRKRNLSEYCRGCLSNDRPLVSIDNHYHIFLKLMDEAIDNIGRQVPKMCWECRAVLRNLERFKRNVKKANEFLNGGGKKMVKAESLSYLQSVVKNNYDIQDIHEEYVDDADVKHIISKQIDLVDNDIATDMKQHDASNELDTEFEIKKEENITDDERFPDENGDIKDEYDVEEIKQEIPTKTENSIKLTKKEKIKDRVEKSKPSKSKFKVIWLSEEIVNYRESCRRVVIDEKEMYCWMEKDKAARNYRSMPYKCELCVTGYANMEHYQKHVRRFHSKTGGNFECDLCKRRYKEKKDLSWHIREHYVKYVCLLCNYENYRAWKLTAHLQTHKKAVVCLTCGLHFGGHHEFYKHYRIMHSRVICDECGKKCSKKKHLIKHIKFRHSDLKCQYCERTYSSFDAMVNHVKMQHVVARTEESYCVECNIQFDNVTRYTVHLKTSVKHKKYPGRNQFCDRTYMSFDAMVKHIKIQHVVTRTEECYCVECNIQFDNVSRYSIYLKTSVKHKIYPGVPCPVCNKVYHKRDYMNSHYRLVHLKESPHRCETCSKCFLGNYRLRLHKERVHDKIPAVKNKICPHCNRAFSTNRMLTNHIHTHTGERPFVCDICLAKFTQKTPLLVHRRNVHKIQK